MPNLKETEEIIDTVRKFSSKQIAVIISIVILCVTSVLFVEDRYAKTKVMKEQLADLNGKLSNQILLLASINGYLEGLQMRSAGLDYEKSSKVNRPMSKEEKEWIEQNRPKLNNAQYEAAQLQNKLVQQRAKINEQITKFQEK